MRSWDTTAAFFSIHSRAALRSSAFRVLAIGASILILLSGPFSIFSFGRKVEMVEDLVQATLRFSSILAAAIGASLAAQVARRTPSLRQRAGRAAQHAGAMLGLGTGLIFLELSLLPAAFLAYAQVGSEKIAPLIVAVFAACLEGSVLLAVLLAMASRLQDRDVMVGAIPAVILGQMVGRLQDAESPATRFLGECLSWFPDMRVFNPQLYAGGRAPFETVFSAETLGYALISVVIWSCIGIMARE